MSRCTRRNPAATRGSPILRFGMLVALLVSVMGSTLLTGSPSLGAASGTSQVSVLLSGYGQVSVDGTSYSCTNADFLSGACPPLSVPIGTTLTFKATPAPVTAPEPGSDPPPDPSIQSEFRGWSWPGCDSAGPCTVQIDDDEEWIVAQFSPVWLEVMVAGTGTVAANGSPPSSCSVDGRCIMGLYEAGSRVTVTGTPTPAPSDWGFGCDPYASDLANGQCVVEMSNIRNFATVGFGQPPDTEPPYNLTVTLAVELAGDGSGQVEDTGGYPWKIDCGTICRAKGVQYQTQARLRATAGSGSEFDRWAGPPCLSQTTCTFTAGKYPKVRAIFKNVEPPPELRVSKTGDGDGTVTSQPAGISCGSTCAATFARGTRVELRAEPNAVSHFAGWSGDCSGDGSCSVTVQGPKSVTAGFERMQDKLDVSRTGDGDGTVTSQPAGISCGTTCAATFPRGTRVGLGAEPNAVSHFAGWSGACTGTGVCAVDLNKPTQVVARFERLRDELRVRTTGDGAGRILSSPSGIACGDRCSARFPRGKRVALRASAKVGSRFAGWGGACSGTGPCVVTLRGPARVAARFTRVCAARSAAGFSVTVKSNPRRVVAAIRLKGNVSARLQLYRGSRKIAEKTFKRLDKGTRMLRLDLPQAAGTGTYRVALRLTDICGGGRSFTRSLTFSGP